MIEIKIEDIIIYKPLKISHSDYRYGGWYMIKNINNNKSYIGKSIEYMTRLKQHIKISNPKTLIDKDIKYIGSDCFKYYLIEHYSKYNIDFFNRKLETIIEQTLIKEHETSNPNGYNVKIYEHLSIK